VIAPIWSITLSQRNIRRFPHQAGEDHFICIGCGLLVLCDPLLAGVQNRNHCPYCLCSRHMDWRVAGDRLSSCRAAMRPVGLTTKISRNKYARERDGELMIIHRCVGCGALVINRVAADDIAENLLALFEDSCASGPALRAELAGAGIDMLTARDRALVRRRLFGAAAAVGN
jgi:hypothetical protein